MLPTWKGRRRHTVLLAGTLRTVTTQIRKIYTRRTRSETDVQILKSRPTTTIQGREDLLLAVPIYFREDDGHQRNFTWSLLSLWQKSLRELKTIYMVFLAYQTQKRNSLKKCKAYKVEKHQRIVLDGNSSKIESELGTTFWTHQDRIDNGVFSLNLSNVNELDIVDVLIVCTYYI